MSLDSEISSCRRKINKRKDAKEQIKKAIINYENARDELGKIKNVELCENLKTNIQTKINELNNLLRNIDREINSYNSKIDKLNQEKMAEANSLNGGI